VIKAAALRTGSAAEHSLTILTLAAIVALPAVDIAGRYFPAIRISGTIPAAQHLTLWIAFLGAALAAKSQRLLSLATPDFLPLAARNIARIFTSALGVAVTFWMAMASVDVIQSEWSHPAIGTLPWGVPIWAVLIIMPAGFAAIAARLAWTASSNWKGRALALCGALLPFAFIRMPELASGSALPLGLIILGLATALGLPIFAAFGGAALLLFLSQGFPASSAPLEAYRLSASANLPAIPLFTLAGYLLAESRASQRLMRTLNSVVGWVPGGLALVTTLLLAFFTTLGSAVTILSLGGLMLPLLTRARYAEKTAIGLVTVGGSTGLLFPPSLPVILYGWKAGINIKSLYLGGLVPGLLFTGVVAIWGSWRGWRSGAPRQPFEWREAAVAIWSSKWELLTPAVILISMFGGYTSLVESAALTVIYAFIVEVLIHRDIHIYRDIPRIAIECVTLVGGFLIILGVAQALATYLSLAEIPDQLLQWVQSTIHSSGVFLLALNAFLIVVGAVGETFSAIFVLVPLIAPMARHYGIDPVHLGVIFIANMELGYLIPPMGANLFLSSYRFNKPLTQIWSSTLPYLALLLVVLMLVTYLPAITLGPLKWATTW
jgi:tripartite ATP-independent transporter DctM subunit